MRILNEIIAKCKQLDADEERKLFEEYQATGSLKAKTRIMESQYGLVISITKKYAFHFGFDDMLQAGMMGLARAVDVYKAGEHRFVKIAWHYIRGAMMDEIRKIKSIASLEELTVQIKSDCKKPDADIFNTELPHSILRAMYQLTVGEKKAIVDYYGIGRPQKTNAQIAQESGKKYSTITSQRVHGMKKLRALKPGYLRVYLEGDR